MVSLFSTRILRSTNVGDSANDVSTNNPSFTSAAVDYFFLSVPMIITFSSVTITSRNI